MRRDRERRTDVRTGDDVMDAANETARLIRRLVEATTTTTRDDVGKGGHVAGSASAKLENDENSQQRNESDDNVDDVEARCRYAARVLGSTLGVSTTTTSNGTMVAIAFDKSL